MKKIKEIDIKIELLETIKVDLEERHKTLREGYEVLKHSKIFQRDADEAVINEMHSIIVAIHEINRFLYPFYWQRDGKTT